MSTACDHCLNAPYCEHRDRCESESGCDDFCERGGPAMISICDEPGLCLTLSKENPATENLLHVEFAIRTDIGVFQFSGEGDLAELCELVPRQIQNAGALYSLLKIFSEEEAR